MQGHASSEGSSCTPHFGVQNIHPHVQDSYQRTSRKLFLTLHMYDLALNVDTEHRRKNYNTLGRPIDQFPLLTIVHFAFRSTQSRISATECPGHLLSRYSMKLGTSAEEICVIASAYPRDRKNGLEEWYGVSTALPTHWVERTRRAAFIIG
jgi:hypothetical protein